MKHPSSGFTLIELLVVIAIIGILAAVAIPFYEGYKVRARLVEVENAMANVTSAVSAFQHDNQAWPNCPTINEVRNSLGVGLGSVERISNLSVSVVNGIITATIQNIHPLVDGETLTLNPTINPGDGSLSWTWGWSPGYPIHMRPKS
jgi:type IV pilus assembly protein PilA